ncbi:hypothetical protein HDR61_03635 [bacterium]|nr:hypothetical protein [bacterium]
MRYIYIVTSVVTVVICAYTVGVHVGRARARADALSAGLQTRIYLLKQMENINAEVVSHSAADIRNVLREKYTIVD